MRRRDLVAFLVAVLFHGAAAFAELADPFIILGKHYEAIGGIEQLKAQRTSHIKGTVVIEGSGLEGTYEEWRERPIRSRQEIDLGIIKQTEGDNGEFSWIVDHNKKLLIRKDERSAKERQVRLLLAEYDHLNRDSENFSVAYEGTDTVAEATCYVVQITNSINDNILTQFIDTSSFLLLKSVEVSPDQEQHTTYSDYREVDGIMIAFQQRVTVYPTGMVQRMQITEVARNIDINPALYEPPEVDVEDFRFTNGKSAEDIPFQLIEDHIFLPLTVGGRTRLWVLDSGASVSCLEKKFAEELGLEPQGQIKGEGAGGLVDVSLVTMPSYEMPGLEFDEQTVAVIDIDWLFRRWMGLEVAGILGYDFLSRLVLKVDYANQLLSFYHPDSFEYTGDGAIIEAPISQTNMFHVPMTVDGKYSGLWHLDLGAGGMGFRYQFAAEHGFLDRRGVQRLGAGAGGRVYNYLVEFKTVEFAGYVVNNPLISIPAAGGEGPSFGGELIGRIGNTLLQHFVLYLDYGREQVIVEKGNNFGKDFPRDNSGMQLQESDSGELEISFVADKTPAAKSGFRKGDILRTVNGINVDLLDGVVAAKKLLQAKPGTKYKITVDRNGQVKTLKLKLEDLFD
jgi:hypothetical protein